MILNFYHVCPSDGKWSPPVASVLGETDSILQNSGNAASSFVKVADVGFETAALGRWFGKSQPHMIKQPWQLRERCWSALKQRPFVGTILEGSLGRSRRWHAA